MTYSHAIWLATEANSAPAPAFLDVPLYQRLIYLARLPPGGGCYLFFYHLHGHVACPQRLLEVDAVKQQIWRLKVMDVREWLNIFFSMRRTASTTPPYQPPQYAKKLRHEAQASFRHHFVILTPRTGPDYDLHYRI
jgi:hypothetical protein